MYDKICELCKKRGLSIRALEIKAGLGNGTIGKMAKGRSPSISTLCKIAEALEVSPMTLLKGVKSNE